MDQEQFEERLEKIDEVLKKLESELKDLSRREKRLHNLVLRLAAINMAVTEALQKHRQIKPNEFEKRVGQFLGSLDQEISDKKTGRYLERIWEEFDKPDA